jgi:hypothetical protein|tara:strand:+ start:1011 stop:2681 length:1671 start_codon:yes stop_codon:yes gene_type:complete
MSNYLIKAKQNKNNNNKNVRSIKDNRSFLNEYDNKKNTFLQAINNVPSSSYQLINDIITPILSPIQTAKDLKALGSSVINLIRPEEQGNEQLAREVGNFFKERYGGIDNIKETFATDPMGMLSDVSIILTGGATLAPKASATANVLTKASKLTSPIENLAGKAIGTTASLTGEGVKQISGVLTGTGAGALDTAIQTGKNYKTGLFANKVQKQKQKDFIDAIKGDISAEKITTDLEKAVKDIKTSKNIDYQNSLKKLKLHEKKINPDTIINKINAYLDQQSTKITLADGKTTMATGYNRFSNKTNRLVNTIKKELDIIKNNPNLHTAEVFHNLKFKIDDMYSKDASGGFAKTNIEIADLIDNQLGELSNGYKSMNKAYSTAKKLEKKLITELGLGNKKGATKIMNQLLSVMKDQNLTNYGTRLETLKTLDNITESNIFEKLAGTTLSNVVPSGLVGRSAMGASVAIPIAESLMTGGNLPITGTGIIPAISLTSPQITGRVGNMLGRTTGVTKNIPFLNLLQRPTGNLQTLRGAGLLGVNRDNSIYENQALKNRGLLN